MIILGETTESQQAKLTAEMVTQLFQYADNEGVLGEMQPNGPHPEIGNCIEIAYPEAFFEDEYKHDTEDEPPHIKWYNNPVFAYIGLVDGTVEYRYSKDGGFSYSQCPVIEDAETIAMINDIFSTWYTHFRLPASLNKKNNNDEFSVNRDKMKLIKQYIESQSNDDFEELSRFDDILFWIDWREYEEDIVFACEDILQSGELEAEACDSEKEGFYNIDISYKDKHEKVICKEDKGGRKSTLAALNNLLAPGHEIRFCKGSEGCDTIAFLVLSADQWKSLEETFTSEKVNEVFAKITSDLEILD